MAPHLALELRVRLVEANLNQKDVIEATGLSRSTVGRYLKGERVPDIDDLDLLAEALGVEANDLVAGAERRRAARADAKG